MVSNNQRAIYERLSKVIGSSNRGFASIDPERQPGSLPLGGKKPQPVQAVPATGSPAAGGEQKNPRL